MRRLRPRARRNPARFIVFAFAVAVLAGTLILMIPAATRGEGGAPFITALFTATSSICVTGLAAEDTAVYWSVFGQVVMVVLVQIGGFGILAGASLIFIAVGRRLGLGGGLRAQRETAALNLADVRRVVLGVGALTLVVETLAAASLALRFWVEGAALGASVWRGVFHSVMAFNHAGFSLFSDSLVGYADDLWVTLTVCVAIVAGGLGVPVWLDLRRRRREPGRWSLHTKLTLATTGVLLGFGTIAFTAFEWTNDRTLGALSPGGRLVAGLLGGVTPRSAGFNSVDYAQVNPETVLVTDMLMFVGGGSGSTAGGIKVATFAVLALMVWAEVRGRPDVTAYGRRVPLAAQRQSLAIAFISLTGVVVGALALMVLSPTGLSDALFESLSAFTTTGLSTGVTAGLPAVAQAILTLEMFVGRIGPLTLGVALLLRQSPQRFRFPEERPIIG